MSQEPILFTGVERQELDDFTVQLGQLPLAELEWLRRHHSLQPPDEVIAYIAAHWQELATLIASRLLEREPDRADADQHRTFVRKTAFWRRKLALIEGEMERRREAAAGSPPPEQPAPRSVSPPPTVNAIEVGPEPATDTPQADRATAPEKAADPAAGARKRSGHWRPATQPPRDPEPPKQAVDAHAHGNGSKLADARLVNELSTIVAGERGAEPEPS